LTTADFTATPLDIFRRMFPRNRRNQRTGGGAMIPPRAAVVRSNACPATPISRGGVPEMGQPGVPVAGQRSEPGVPVAGQRPRTCSGTVYRQSYHGEAEGVRGRKGAEVGLHRARGCHLILW